MKRTIVFLSILVAGLGVHKISRSGDLTAAALEIMRDRYQFFVVIEPTGDEPLRYVYADIGPHVHVYEVKKGKANLAWETGNMGAPVTALLVGDLDKDGRPTIVVATLNGRLIAYDAITYERAWENFQEPFRTISSLIAANIDADPQDEVILVGENELGGGSFIFIYDSVTRGLEWRSQENFHATELAVANVDDDPQLEIILNSGFIIDSRFYNIDKIKSEGGGFGERMTLQDLNDDGYPEIIGRVPNRSIIIWDPYAERDIW